MLPTVRALTRALARAPPAAARAFSAPAPAPAPGASPPAALVKQLRELTGAGFVDCQRALAAEGHDVARAVDALRRKGLAAAAKRSGRAAAQGLVAVALGAGAGAAVELNCETDFVARNAGFQALAARLAGAALSAVPPPAGAGAGADRFAAATAAASAFVAQTLPAGADAAAAPAVAVGTGVAELGAKVGENVVLRRAAALAARPGGLVCAYVHAAAAPGLGSIGVLVSLAPRDAPAAGAAPLAASHAAFAPLEALGRRVAMHAAAQRPAFLAPGEVPPAALERERAVLRAQAAASGKDAKNVDKMVQGRLQKFFAECCLLEQPFVLGEDGAKVAKVVEAASAKAGYPAVVADFVVFSVGEAAPAPTGGEAKA